MACLIDQVHVGYNAGRLGWRFDMSKPYQARRRSPMGRAQLFILGRSPTRVARRSRAPCRRSGARVVRPVARPSPEARPVERPPRDDCRNRDPSATPQDRRHPTHGLVGAGMTAAHP
eukprot:366166-Chlamydomonas_euryale.AAC.17